MTEKDVALWDVGEAVRFATEHMSIENMASEIISNIPVENRSLFLAEANTTLLKLQNIIT